MNTITLYKNLVHLAVFVLIYNNEEKVLFLAFQECVKCDLWLAIKAMHINYLFCYFGGHMVFGSGFEPRRLLVKPC